MIIERLVGDQIYETTLEQRPMGVVLYLGKPVEAEGKYHHAVAQRRGRTNEVNCWWFDAHVLRNGKLDIPIANRYNPDRLTRDVIIGRLKNAGIWER